MRFCRILLAAGALAASPAAAQIRAVTLHPPSRDFAYVIGDVLTVETEIFAGSDARIAAGSLPVPGPVTPAIDLTHIEVSRDTSADTTRFTLRVRYQSFFAPEQPTQTQVPGYTVTLVQGTTRLIAKVPAWSFYTAAFRADRDAPPEFSTLKPDHQAVPSASGGLKARFFLACAVALAACLALAQSRGWLPSLRASAKKPFARASRRMATLLRGPAAPDMYDAALLELHRAFDTTAKRSVLPGDLDSFLSEHRAYGPLRPEIERFFAASRQEFFAADPSRARRDAPPDWLLLLGRRLRRAERA